MSFSNNLYSLRIKRGLSQKKLADKAGVSQTAIYQWEKGIRSPKIEQLKKIADALDVRIAELVTMDWVSESIEDERINHTYSAIDMAIKDNIDKMNNSAKKKVYDYTEDLLENPKNIK